MKLQPTVEELGGVLDTMGVSHVVTIRTILQNRISKARQELREFEASLRPKPVKKEKATK